MRVFLVLATTLLGLVASDNYEGYKVYKVSPKTRTETELLKVFQDNSNFDFWSKLNWVGKPVSIMVKPEAQNHFVEYLKNSNISYITEIENVEGTIQAEKLYHASKKRVEKGRIAFDQYLRHDEINAYLAQLAKDYPDLVSIETIGQSYEGRDLVVIHITAPSPGPKPVIFLDAGIHAREWIAPAVALYLIHQLVENEANRQLVQDVEWIILPVLNPDGYEYTHTSQRLWRKTRTPGLLCYGVDANRNYDFHWMEAGASSSECSETYAGVYPFSEVENVVLRDYLLSTRNVKLYLSLHSYGQYLLYSWGFTTSLPDNSDELQELGDAVNAAISSVAGTKYAVGSSTLVLYSAAGNSVDWSKGVAGIELAYTIELPGGGYYGFDIPASRILPVSEETWEGFKVFHNYVAKIPT